jgi:hypothetical protein
LGQDCPLTPALSPVLHQRWGRGRKGARHLIDDHEEAFHRILRASGQFAGAAQFIQCGLPHRGAFGARAAAQRVERAIADAARRRVHSALERGVVVAVGGEAQVRQGVLDFRALEEALAAVDAVRHIVLDQLFFEVARLCVGAVQDRAIFRVAVFGDVFADALDHEARFVLFVVGGVHGDAFAFFAGGPQLFAKAAAVAFDHAVGGLEDVGGGAVVLFQLDRAGAGKIAQELLHVLDLGAAPAVDRLIVVADYEDLAGVAGEHADPRVLQRVGVLEFVDQQIAPALLVVLQDRRLLQPQLVRAQQQFGEIHQARAAAGVFVGLVDLHQRARDRVMAVLDVVGALAFVFPAVDLPGGLARRETRFVQAEAGDHALDQPLLVVGIEDLEAFRQPRLAPVPAQQAVRDAVEGADGETLRAAGDQLVQARAHLARGLVGEGDGEDRPRRRVFHLGEPADAVGEHARLAGTGAGQHQVMAGRGADGFALRVVERVDQVRDIHPWDCNGWMRIQGLPALGSSFRRTPRCFSTAKLVNPV